MHVNRPPHNTHLLRITILLIEKKSYTVGVHTEKEKKKTVILDWFDCFLPLQKGQDFFFFTFLTSVLHKDKVVIVSSFKRTHTLDCINIGSIFIYTS